ncbi:zinc finger, CCHC-type containing protein [Tanacetum coccineum]|uniref:Zinc finger, CCHC-type containing protein n=1 Tax=Tanacetum coccineum TaxID=301880 RepID=A0ABQ5B8Z2_9ASTR
MISDQDVSGATRFINELNTLTSKSRTAGTYVDSYMLEIPRLIALHMANLGGEVSYHKFQNQPNKFHPLHFFTSPDAEANHGNTTCESYATNTVGIIRAPRGDGKESIVLVTPYNPVNLSQNEALSLGIAYSAFSLLNQYNSVAAWLRDYHTPSLVRVNFSEAMSSLVNSSSSSISLSNSLVIEIVGDFSVIRPFVVMMIYWRPMRVYAVTWHMVTPNTLGLRDRKHKMENTYNSSNLLALAVVRLPDPKRKTLGEKGIDCIFVGYAEHSKAYRDDHSDDVPSETPEPRRGTRARKAKSYGCDFQLYLVEGSRGQVGSQYSYCYSIEEDPITYNEVMQSRDAAFRKEEIDDEIGSIMDNNIWVLSDLPQVANL